MANTQRSVSVFDEMLVQTRKKFDDLYQGGPPRAGNAGLVASQFGPERTGVPSPAIASSLRLGPDSPAVRQLNERFGDNWRYEIAEQQRDGDEAIVLCKLTFGKEGASRTQFGRAKISRGHVAGASGGVRFTLNAAGSEPDKNDASRRAAEAALINCIEVI
jgi:hypothetical protein